METWIMSTILASNLTLAVGAFWYLLGAINKKASKEEVDEKIKTLKEILSNKVNENYEKLLLINQNITQKIDFNHSESSKDIKNLTAMISSFCESKKNLP
jgi:hypothetical protein